MSNDVIAPSPPNTTTEFSEIAAGEITSLLALALQRTAPLASNAMTSALLVPTTTMSTAADTPPETSPLPAGVCILLTTAPVFSSNTVIVPVECAAYTKPLATTGIKLLTCLPPSGACHAVITAAPPLTAGNGRIFLSELENQPVTVEQPLSANAADTAKTTDRVDVVASKLTAFMVWLRRLAQQQRQALASRVRA